MEGRSNCFMMKAIICTLGDDAGTYKCKVGAKKDGTITAFHWHMVGVRNPAVDKTYEGTKIPNIRGSQEWATGQSRAT